MNLSLVLAILSITSLVEVGAEAQVPVQPKIKNFHSVDSKGTVLRGAQPGNQVKQLAQLKVTHVVIVKKQLHSEVDSEIAALRDVGIQADVFPLEWNEGLDLKKTCHDVVDAVQTIQNYKRTGKKVYFHCTAGEDRTGLIAGLFRMVDQGWTSDQAFKKEMCANGYSDGDKNKPRAVTTAISKTLTPIFVALSKNLTASGGLNPSACTNVRVLPNAPTCSSVGE